jgi:hypothetical protein
MGRRAAMSTNRTPLHRQPQAQITPAAVEAFKRALELHDAAEVESAANRTGVQGPIQSEWNAARSTCHRECGLKPWEINVLDVHGSQKEPRSFDSPESWRKARELRAALLQAAGLEPEG